MSFVVVPDACVLFPASLRDTMLRAANANLYEVRLTEDILEEVRRNLVKKGELEYKAQRLVDTIRDKFDHAFVPPHKYKLLISSMPNDAKDRHVLAAAVASNAQTIVTQNLRHFPKNQLAPYEVEALSPDKFLTDLFDLNSECMTEIVKKQAKNLRNPPMTVSQVLDTLHQHVPTFVQLVRNELHIVPEYSKADSHH